ncbi:MAG: DCC1-like thiol-disulfide oxidoreductase family protein [Bacteroidota bacterium]
MGAVDPLDHQVIFFDGVCNLCNASVLFIIKRDKKAYFRFSSLQSNYAQSVLPPDLIDENNLQSLVLQENGKTLTRSSAALRIAWYLPRFWSLLYIFIIIPKFMRDAVYDLIAKNRYKWFGKREECMIPSEELNSRFIESLD